MPYTKTIFLKGWNTDRDAYEYVVWTPENGLTSCFIPLQKAWFAYQKQLQTIWQGDPNCELDGWTYAWR